MEINDLLRAISQTNIEREIRENHNVSFKYVQRKIKKI